MNSTHAKCTVTQEAGKRDSVILKRHEGRGKNLYLVVLYQPSSVTPLREETWVPIKNIPIFLITFINTLEPWSPVSSDTTQTTAVTQEPWSYCIFAQLFHTYRKEASSRSNWKSAYYKLLSSFTDGKLPETRWVFFNQLVLHVTFLQEMWQSMTSITPEL